MSWKTIKLGEVIKHRKGFVTIDDDVEYKLCRVQLHRKGVVLREIIKGEMIRTKKQQVCRSGDFIVAEMDAKVGGYGFVPAELNGAIVSSHYFLFELNEEKIRPKYLDVICQLRILQDQIEAIGSTNYAAIRPVNVLNWNIPIPTIEKQIEIENLFSSVKLISSKLANELTHQLALVKNLRQQLLQDAVQGKLTPQNPEDEPAGALLKKIKAEKEKLLAEKKLKKEKALPPIKPEEIPFEIPGNWVWCRLGEICTKITDGTHHSPTNLQDGEYKYVTAKNIKDGGIDLTDITYVTKDVHNEIYARCNPEKEDILYIKDGATTGIVTINNLDEEFSMLSSVALLKLSSLLNNKFIVYTMRSPFYYNATRAGMYGVAITRVTLEKIKNSFIPLPPLSEQTRIVQKLEELMRYCDGLEAGIRESMAQNERLLQQVLREALRG